MDCCPVDGFHQTFTRSVAQRELKAYLKKGLSKRAQLLVDFLKGQGISGATVLEIGGGVGSLHLELLQAGAASAVDFDASPAYVEAATSLAERLGLQDSVEYRVGDFAEQATSAEDADIVLLDRVICCYPDMKALVAASGRHTKRLCLLTYPRRTWGARAFASMANLLQAVLRKKFRVFVHHPQEVSAMLASQGLTRIFQDTAGFLGVWEFAVYQRQETTPSTS